MTTRKEIIENVEQLHNEGNTVKEMSYKTGLETELITHLVSMIRRN